MSSSIIVALINLGRFRLWITISELKLGSFLSFNFFFRLNSCLISLLLLLSGRVLTLPIDKLNQALHYCSILPSLAKQYLAPLLGFLLTHSILDGNCNKGRLDLVYRRATSSWRFIRGYTPASQHRSSFLFQIVGLIWDENVWVRILFLFSKPVLNFSNLLRPLSTLWWVVLGGLLLASLAARSVVIMNRFAFHICLWLRWVQLAEVGT